MFFPDAAKAEVDWGQQTVVIPTVPSTLPNLEAKVSGILAKVDKIPFEAIGNEVKQTLRTLNQTISEIDKAVGHIDTGVTPTISNATRRL